MSFQALSYCWNHALTWRSWASLEALCGQMADEGPGGEKRPSAHSFPTPEPCEWVTDKAVNMLISQILGRAASWVTPLAPDVAIVFRVLGVGTFRCTAVFRDLSPALWGVDTGEGGTRGQMEVEGPVVVALRLQRVPWAEFCFVLDLTPQSSHSDSLEVLCFSVLHWFPLRAAGSVTVSPSRSPPGTYKHATGVRTVSVRHLYLSSFKLF